MGEDPGFHSFHARSLRGEDIALSRYAGKVVLVVNTASRCGFTPQYAGLEDLHRRFAGEGLAILGFPCNQFGGQEPGGADTVEACLVNYGVGFQMFDKVEVDGADAHPLFAWLTAALPGVFGRAIRWNFTKFLIGRDGRPIRRFAPFVTPAALAGPIRKALATG